MSAVVAELANEKISDKLDMTFKPETIFIPYK
jgi:hypothetical protein